MCLEKVRQFMKDINRQFMKEINTCKGKGKSKKVKSGHMENRIIFAPFGVHLSNQNVQQFK